DMTTLRRAFHTLKGSSRMVGLNEFGEAGWSMEQVLNTWLADQKPSTEDLRTLCTRALQGFGRWIEDIAGNTDGSWKAAAFRTAADAMRTESRLVQIVLPAAAAAPEVTAPQAVEAVAPELPAAPAQDAALLSTLISLDPEPEATPPVAAAAQAPALPDLADLGFTLDLGNDLPSAQPLGADVVDDPTLALRFDAAATPLPEVSPLLPAPTEVSELRADELPPEFADFGAAPVQSQAESAAVPEADSEPEELAELASTAILPKAEFPLVPPAPLDEAPLEISGIDFSSLSAVSGPAPAPQPVDSADDFVFDLSAATAAPVENAPAALEPVAEPAAPQSVDQTLGADADAGSPARDEQVKVIGSLRIGIPLYNVYLNEADEWSRRLATEISEWTLEMNQQVPDSTVGWAHALAGSSATVGFHALSDIARALEGALQHTQGIACGTPAHAQTFTEAAEEVRRLLHQFAAGFLKEPDARLLRELQALKDAEGELRAEPTRDEAPLTGFADIEFQQFGAQPQAELPAPLTPPAAYVPPVQVGPMLRPVQNVPIAPQRAMVSVSDEDDLDVTDAIDPDLFPIFEEEAADLMPALGGSLRLWAAHPGQREPRDQVLRALHTLKGSARLAGALRLGELAHRLESEVEHLGSDNIVAADIEQLLQRFDTMQAHFDTLRATGGFAPAEAQAQAVAATPVAVQPPAPDAPRPTAPAAPVLPVQPVVAAPQRMALAMPVTSALGATRQASNQAVRVRSQLLDRLVNQAGEVMITRSRLEAELKQLRGSLGDLTGNLDRLRSQLRDIELQAESQMQSRMAQAKDTASGFDPLEFDRFTRVQELTRMMAE
ncbi:MAG: putative histidine kinase, CheA, partial [Ramlibacter sp.]|nr:putative histidine kinase, CheA [Ramlibacter sp.]